MPSPAAIGALFQSSAPLVRSSAATYGAFASSTSTNTRPPLTTGAPTIPPPNPALVRGSWRCQTSLPFAALSAYTTALVEPRNTQPRSTTGVLWKAEASPTDAVEKTQAGLSEPACAGPSARSSGWLRVLARSCPYTGHSPLLDAAALHGAAAAVAGTAKIHAAPQASAATST